MTSPRELLAQAADELGYKADAHVLRKGGGAFIQVNAALLAIESARRDAAGRSGADAGSAG